jgi:hypothetical protein
MYRWRNAMAGLCLAGLTGFLHAEPVNLLPNGSFEFWTRFSTNYVREQAERLGNSDPLVPVRWADNHYHSRIKIERVEDARGGKYAAAASGGTQLAMKSLEVLPGAEYTYGVWIKGAGQIMVWVDGYALEGSQGLAGAKGTATGEWQRVGGTFRPPPHIRRVALRLDVLSGRILLDDAHIAAELDQPYDADAVLRDPYGADGHTVLFENFEGMEPRFKTEYPKLVRVTEPGKGRFGRGLRLDPISAASFPLTLDKMPEEGTLEFWMAPDGPRNSKMVSLPLDSRFDLMVVGLEGFNWLENATGEGKTCWMPYDGSVPSAVQIRGGFWRHTAITWDRTAVRTYVDGVLMSMQLRREIKWPGSPKFLQVGEGHFMSAVQGVVDEIRLSNVRRYGPVVPRGAVYTPPAALPEAPGAAGQSSGSVGSDRSDGSDKAPTAEQVAAGRSALLSPLPAPEAGAVVLDAATARPIVEGGWCGIESNKLVAGLTLVRMGGLIGRHPDEACNGGVYWRLGAIEPGAYWIGVWYESGNDKAEASQPASAPVQVYLNGRMVQLATHSEPVQVKPGVHFAEALTGEAVALRPGDEITVGRPYGGAVARVILRKTPPAAGPHRIATNFGGHQWNPYTALGVNVEAIFKGRDGKALPYPDQYDAIERQAWNRAAALDSNGLARVDFVFANPLPVAVTIRHECVVRSYYFEEAARDDGQLTIPAHGRVVRPVRFAWAEDAPSYSAFATLRGEQVSGYGTSHEKRSSIFVASFVGSFVDEARDKAPDKASQTEIRGAGKKITADTLVEVLGWPEHEVYSYFEGHRHALPWPDPFAYRLLRRVTLKTARDPYRDRLMLDAPGHEKVWERALTTALEPPMPPPADLKFEPFSVPFGWGWNRIADIKPRPHGAYARRTVVLPADLKGRSYRLTLSEATDEATVYVNGRKVGNLRGAHTPLVCDITRAVKPGTNDLTIVVRDLLAIMNPAYVNTNSPTTNLSYLDAPGLFGDQNIGMGSVTIDVAPAVSVEEVFAIPSVRKKTLGVCLKVGNRSETPVRARVKVVVLDGGKPVLALGEREVELASHVPVQVELETPWKDPRLWGPTDPHLYTLAVEVTDATTGARLDWRRERFGFRESWIAGPYIMFNGIPIRPRGAAPITRLNPDGEFRLTRGLFSEWADEAGLLGGCYLGGLQNSPSAHNVARDVFWAAAESNALSKMKLYWNRPSIQTWDLSNEWLCYLWNDQALGARRFKHLSDVVRAADPTRWTHANAEGDLHGLLDNYSFHYMEPYFIAGNQGGFGMNGHADYLPDGQFWRPLSRLFNPGETVPLCPHHSWVKLKLGEKVIMDTEYLWKCGDILMPPGPTRWVGEDDVLSPAVDSASGPIAWMWKTKLDGHRDLGVAPINIYSDHAGVQRGAYLDQTFIIPENQRRGFGGRTETRRYTVLNGVFRTADMRLSWDLRRADGKVLRKGRFRHRLPSGGQAGGEFAFTLPKVTKPTVHTLRATLEADGKFIAREEWDIEVWPDQPVPAGKLARQVVVYEPGTSNSQQRMLKTSEALTAAGVAFQRMPDPGAPSTPPEQTLLVIGENALSASNVAHTASLAKFVAAGGRVLVLRQGMAPQGLPVTLESREWSSQVFLRLPTHPVLAGLDPLALHFWQPDRSVATGSYGKPATGNSVTLADSGGRTGMEWTQLLEFYRGKGQYLLCQMPVVERYAAEPMARELLARLVRYAAGTDTFCQPTNSLTVVAAEDSPVVKRLAEVGAKVESGKRKAESGKQPVSVEGERPTANVQRPTSNGILVDAAAGRDLAAAERAALGAALRGGATVVVAGATPADTNWLSELAGTPVSVTVTPYRMWEGRAYRRGWSRWTAGLSHLDHYWKRYDGDEGASMQAENPANVLEPLQYYSVRVAGGQEQVYPGALVEVTVGQGRLLLDQRRWWTSQAAVAKLARRQVSALMTGLNVAVSPPPPARGLPESVDFRPVNLGALANRSLFDETAGDGKGGWTDEGSACDLRRFPRGWQHIYGVPFDLGPSPTGAVALVSRTVGGAGGLPGEVLIPLGFAAEGLYFLNVAAGCADRAPAGEYRIEYEDGQSARIALVGGDNILDWTRPHQLRGARGTQSQIVWTGSNGRHPLIAVTRLLWVNPRPGAPLRAVTFANPAGEAMPVLFGLTAAVPKGRVALTPEAAARGKDLLAKGQAAAAAEKWDEARRLLTEALKQDPALDDGYRLLADVAERKQNEEWQLEAYRLWAATGPRLPLPWNRIGDILERRKDLAGALEAYKKSLETEWNQPPIMEARRRLEAVVKP